METAKTARSHKASKRGSKDVVIHGTSAAQQQYIRTAIENIAGEGGRPVLVLDGRAYPPKLTTRAERRAKAAAAKEAAEDAVRRGDAAEARKKWAEAAAPKEEFWAWLLRYAVKTGVAFVVAPYEADAQLISLAEDLGWDRVVVWAAANDSDLVVFGGLDVIYDWDAVKRTFRRVGIFDVLGKVVGARRLNDRDRDRGRVPPSS